MQSIVGSADIFKIALDSGNFDDNNVRLLRAKFHDVNRWNDVLVLLKTSGFVPVKWDIKFVENFNVREDKFVSPMRKDRLLTNLAKMDKLDRELSIRMINRHLGNYGPLKLRNLVLVLLSTHSAASDYEKRMWGRLIYYLDWSKAQGPNSENEYEPFIEIFGSMTLKQITHDTDSMKRIYTILNCIFWMQHQIIDHDILEEVAVTFLENGSAAMLPLKDMCGPVLFGALSKSREGFSAVWSYTNDGTVSMKKVPLSDLMNDDYVYETQKEEYKKLMDKVDGLPLVKAKLIYLFDCPVNDRSLKDIGVMFFLEGMFGYYKSNIVVTHPGQIKADIPEEDIPEDGAAQLRNEVKEIWLEILNSYSEDIGNIDTVEEWHQKLGSYMTGKSGGVAAKAVAAMMGNRLLTIKSNLKNWLFSLDPFEYLDMKSFFNCLTVDNPGTLGTRDVPGRTSRMIWVVPLPVYIVETMFYMLAYQVAFRMGRYYFGKASSSSVVDNWEPLSTMDGNTVSIGADIKGLDASLRKSNMTAGMTAAYTEWMEGIPQFKEPIGDGYKVNGTDLTWQTIYPFLVEKLDNAIFEMPDGSRVRGSGVLSGEKSTALKDTVATDALNRIILNEYAKQVVFSVISKNFLGDDSKILISVKEWNLEKCKLLYEVYFLTPPRHGLVINRVKTIIGRFRIEYLKVPVYMGRICPRVNNLQVWAGEHTSNAQGILQVMKSVVANFRLFVARGGIHELAIKQIYVTFAIAGRIKRSRSIKGLVDLPMACLFVPQKLGGIGMFMWGLHTANCDSIVPFYPEDILNKIKDASRGISVSRDMKHDAAAVLVTTGKFKGVEYNRMYMDIGTKNQAILAIKKLDSLGFKAPRRNFLTIPEDIVVQTMEGMKEITWLGEARNEANIASMKMPIDEKRWNKVSVFRKQIDVDFYLVSGERQTVADVWTDVFPVAGALVFHEFKFLYPRCPGSGNFSSRMETKIRSMLVRAGINMVYSASYVINLILDSLPDTERAYYTILALGVSPSKVNVVTDMINFISLNESQLMFEGDGYSVNDAIFSELGFRQADYERFFVLEGDKFKYSPAEISKIQKFCLFYCATMVSRVYGKQYVMKFTLLR